MFSSASVRAGLGIKLDVSFWALARSAVLQPRSAPASDPDRRGAGVRKAGLSVLMLVPMLPTII
jgi:hypothetical protein